MWNKLRNLFPCCTEADNLRNTLKGVSKVANKYKLIVDSLRTELANTLANNSTPASRIHVTDHAIHRYIERFDKKAKPKEVEVMLFNHMLRQLKMLDTLSDGQYHFKKGLIGVIVNNTLVTVLPKRSAVVRPKLR